MLDKFAIFLLWFAAVFDPIGLVYGIRYFALGLVSLSLGSNIIGLEKIRRINNLYVISFCFFVIFVPFYGLFLAMIRGGLIGSFIDTSYLSGAAYFFFSLIYLFRTNLESAIKIHIFVLRSLCVLIVLCLVSILLGFSFDWIYFFVARGVAFYGERSYGGLNFYYIYFIASPMIIFLLAYDAWQFFERPTLLKLGLLLLPVCALFLSGTRANIIISIFGVIFIYFWGRLNFRSFIFIFAFFVFFALFFIVFDFSVISDMFDPADLSINQKLSYLSVYSEIFYDPFILLFGQGFNAHEWSMELSGILEDGASKTELTYIEFLRVFGLVGFLGFIFILGWLVISARSMSFELKWMPPALLMYLMVAAVNPYIFSSNGMLLLGIYAVAVTISFQYKNKKEIKVSI